MRLQPMLLSVNYSSRRQRDHMQQKEQRSTSCSFRMASCCWSRSHSRRARSSAAPVTPRASASSVAVPAASLWPLMRQSCACCSQHVPASASSPASTASCRRSARIGSCSHTVPLPLQISLVSLCSSCQSKKSLDASSARSVSIHHKWKTYSRHAIGGPKQIYRNRLLKPVGINSGALSEDQEPYNSTKSRHVRAEHTWVAREDWVMRRRSSQRRTRWRSMGPREPRAAT